MDTSLPLINWNDATGSNFEAAGSSVGQDVLIGIIDSGIDHQHPFFAVNAANAAFYTTNGEPDGQCKYTNNDTNNWPDFTSCKVVVAKVFHSDTTHTPQDFIAHGTHVAGTTGGNSGTPADTGLVSGVAPAAVLGNYNVFPGDVGSASSDDIANAVEEAVEDGMDVLNLSLGGTPESTFDVLDLALRGAADVGVVSAVAAGNSGPGAETVESPGWSPWVITAGATTNSHFNGQQASHATAGSAGAAVGDFDAFPDPAVTYPFVWWDTIDGRGTGEACESRPPRGANLSGQIALIKRGACTFTTKIRNAQTVGAVGVVIFNNVAGDPTAMAHDGTDPFPSIPAVMVGKSYGESLSAHSGTQLTVGGAIAERNSDNEDIIAGFSSRGPADTPDGLIVKPDMSAPGVNINSSIPCVTAEGETTECGWAFFQGTSMATPHLAGAAAALIWDRQWDAAFAARDEQVKSLLVNNALQGVVKDHVTGNNDVGVNVQGTGRLELVGAFDGTFYANPVGFYVGRVSRGGLSGSATVTLSGETSGLSVVNVTQPSLAGVSFTTQVSGNDVTLTLTRGRGVRGDAEGVVTISNGAGEQIHLVYFARFE
ncbi:MAG: S8 family serine peptidase [Chloroflexota bacterium]|nr:S8 family serine peptidase [Chloroflexota bacterium]